MPILWRYLLLNYFRILFISFFSLTVSLYAIRFKEIAHFAASGSTLSSILIFGSYQMLYTVPLALAISSGISSMITLYTSNQRRELISLYSAGISPLSILLPFFLSGMALSILNLALLAELIPRYRSKAYHFSYETVMKSPFHIINQIAQQREDLSQVEEPILKEKNRIEKILIVFNNPLYNRLNLLSADKLSLEKEHWLGEKVEIVSSFDSEEDRSFDHLMIEHRESFSMETVPLSKTKEPFWSAPGYMRLKDLLLTISSHRELKFILELFQRISLTTAPFILTLSGAAFGVEISSYRSRRGISWFIGFTLLYLISFITVKAARFSIQWSALFYFLPPILILYASLQNIRSIVRGRR